MLYHSDLNHLNSWSSAMHQLSQFVAVHAWYSVWYLLMLNKSELNWLQYFICAPKNLSWLRCWGLKPANVAGWFLVYCQHFEIELLEKSNNLRLQHFLSWLILEFQIEYDHVAVSLRYFSEQQHNLFSLWHLMWCESFHFRLCLVAGNIAVASNVIWLYESRKISMS